MRSHQAWRAAGLSWGHEGAARAPEVAWPGRRVLAVAAGTLVVVGVGAFALGGGDEERGPAKAASPALVEGAFAADPAARADGLVQQFTAVTSAGGVVVVAGTEGAGDGATGRDRTAFVVSPDEGRTWRQAPVDAAVPGDRPQLVAGGSGRWVALGEAGRGGTALWTSADALRWTRLAASFGPKERVKALVRTPGGFTAVGTSNARAAAWTSADGRTWRRFDPGGDITGFDRVVASGNALVAHGTFATRGKKPKRGEGLWRSADGGQRWTPVNLPQAKGSFGPSVGLAVGPGGVYAVREGKRVTGPKKRRKTARFAVVFGAADGSAWAPVAELGAMEFGGVRWFAGGPTGLAAVVLGKGGARLVLRSADGRAWKPAGDLGAPGPGASLSGLAVAGGGAVAAGRQGDDAYLAVAGTSATVVDLTKIPGVVRPERVVAGLASAGNRAVAVGSTNGDAAVWTTAGGTTWRRATSTEFGGGRLGGRGQGRQRLLDVVATPKGWLAAGRWTGAKAGGGPLVVTSPDGAVWTRAKLPDGQSASGAASGPSGHVVVGAAKGTAAAWHSADLAVWTRGGNAGKGDLDGATWMRDVAATTRGYVAVGGRKGGRPGAGGAELPAIWTSQDGRKWTAVASPSLPSGLVSGSLTQVVARGDLLVAPGWGVPSGPAPVPVPLAAVSADGGRTWRTHVPEGAASLTAAAATGRGLVIAGTTGAPGSLDAALWSTSDGTSWRRTPGPGGPGDQRLTALSTLGHQLVGAGVGSGASGEAPLLWRAPTP
ncbi:hypothetical protein [Spirillospora sp. CA-294931]|uniref:hypothetical protein n=1 Tax=Spirillospora sp. CA-294931 TaxID=3240042 RepID=UPI003D8CFEDA